MAEVTVTMPLELTADMLRAVRRHPTTSTEDKDDENRRIGWLLCSWDVLLQHKRDPLSRPPNLEPVIAWLENGCDPKEAAKELRIYQAVMHPKTPNVELSGPPR
jgi:hypothetical protein